MEWDYFYDKDMYGVDWDDMYEKYVFLVDWVIMRNEFLDVIGCLVGELFVLYIGVGGGDMWSDNKSIFVVSLGVEISRDEVNGGFRIDYIYKVDLDYFNWKFLLDDFYLDI